MEPREPTDPEPQRQRRRDLAGGCLTAAGLAAAGLGILLLILPFWRVNRWVGRTQIIADRAPAWGLHLVVEDGRYAGRETDIWLVQIGPFWWGVQRLK